MIIECEITKEQIRDYILEWKTDEILDFVKELEEWLEDWDFTIELWLILHKAMCYGFDLDREYMIEAIRRIKNAS